jgi:hypothetical protein
MYSLRKNIHPDYGAIIEIVREENGACCSPFEVEKAAKKERRLWVEVKKVRFLIDGQVFNRQQLSSWAKQEYLEIPKCGWCITFLREDIYTHTLSDLLFCSQKCADFHYTETEDHLNDHEEFDL